MFIYPYKLPPFPYILVTTMIGTNKKKIPIASKYPSLTLEDATGQDGIATLGWSLCEVKWRSEPIDVEKSADELWLGVKCHSNPVVRKPSSLTIWEISGCCWVYQVSIRKLEDLKFVNCQRFIELIDTCSVKPILANIMALLLFLGQIAKSAQFPDVWLPDTMEGPTPISWKACDVH